MGSKALATPGALACGGSMAQMMGQAPRPARRLGMLSTMASQERSDSIALRAAKSDASPFPLGSGFGILDAGLVTQRDYKGDDEDRAAAVAHRAVDQHRACVCVPPDVVNAGTEFFWRRSAGVEQRDAEVAWERAYGCRFTELTCQVEDSSKPRRRLSQRFFPRESSAEVEVGNNLVEGLFAGDDSDSVIEQVVEQHIRAEGHIAPQRQAAFLFAENPRSDATIRGGQGEA